jgi:hypothetical protein
MTLFTKTLPLVATLAILVSAAPLPAADTTTSPAPASTGPATQPANRPEVHALRTASRTLAKADHDYKGHRVAAMHALEAACDLLGSDIRGDGKGREPQALSDAQLRQALAVVQKVHDAIPAGKQPRIVAHLNQALQQITTALTIK